MTVGQAIERLKYDRDMCLFDPTTGMSSDQIRQLRNGMRLALSEKTAKEAERYYQQTGDRS